MASKWALRFCPEFFILVQTFCFLYNTIWVFTLNSWFDGNDITPLGILPFLIFPLFECLDYTLIERLLDIKCNFVCWSVALVQLLNGTFHYHKIRTVQNLEVIFIWCLLSILFCCPHPKCFNCHVVIVYNYHLFSFLINQK